MARAAAGAWLKAAGWTAGTSLRVSHQLRKLAVDPNAAQDVIDEVTREVREVARDFLGISELESEVREMAPLLSTGLLKAGSSSPAALRAQGEQLLREAADVGFNESAHPAFARILTELSPDEARILRLLAIEGAQPMVDVRAANLIGSGSQLVAQSLNMLGPKAGLRQRDRVPVYLANLVRVNLIVLSEDSLDSPIEYQVLEAQPEILGVLHDTARAKVVRRSVLLTPLGREFCEICLPITLPALPPPAAS
ncbi:MAG TPA: Abi-alpha family protein [Solirubrobacteraceae bacterium]|nr:Abi-alpha family protein [Solirubrobacteraceae bacterium]